jgi:hypothetical protein
MRGTRARSSSSTTGFLKDRQAESPEQRLPVLRGLADPAYPRVGSLHTQMSGATMDIAEIDVGRSIFEYGQTYVASYKDAQRTLPFGVRRVAHHDEPDRQGVLSRSQTT